ncbi:MAG: aminotransferase class I/II-fold pyridoxal phosphate-dependent enzyme [Deltaproteobacteria bacterium]|nr:aminotransferase class I/II-fold pyridoxal phosphate-dependent enzyme [Deltaproteobacteria bacterium]
MPNQSKNINENEPHRGSSFPVRKAIILAAGKGSRLGPFTEHTPKCLAPINGVPILINMLTHLADVGVEETVIVVGYLKEKIYAKVGNSFNKMKITYIESDQYETTNNIYSLWLAREHLNNDVILLESDVFFELLLLDRLFATENRNVAVVARYQSWMSGTVVILDKENNLQALLETRHQGPQFDYSKVFKTVNIYMLSREFLCNQFVPRLEAFVASGDVNQYYEIIFHAMAYNRQYAMMALVCNDIKWFEVDYENDRLTAEYSFASPDERYEIVAHEHGSYWQYGFIDHTYLYNLYFPPEAVFFHMQDNIRDLVESYPVGQDSLARLVGQVINQPTQRIAVGNGAAELIKIISRRLSKIQIIPEPSFNEYSNAAPKGKVTGFALKPPLFQLDVDEFATEALNCKADVAVVVSPNNPTSLIVPKADLLRLAVQLNKQNCILIVDESFIDFAENSEQASLEQDIAKHKNLAIIKSMSKAYGICGLRLGYLLTVNQELISAVRNEIPIWNINGFAEAFLRLLPRYSQDFIESCRKVRSDRDALYHSLSSIPGMLAYKPDANFVFCRLPDKTISGPEITRRLFIEHNIYVKHCAEKPLPESDRYLRIASRTKPENHKLVEALRSIVGRKQQ